MSPEVSPIVAMNPGTLYCLQQLLKGFRRLSLYRWFSTAFIILRLINVNGDEPIQSHFLTKFD